MVITSLKFEVEDFDGGIEGIRAGDHIEIAYQGMPVMAFDVNDTVARDWTIASLLRTGLKGKTVAQLCHTSQAQVSNVRKLERIGGYIALAQRQKAGRPKKFKGKKLADALTAREQGGTVRQIATDIDEPPATVGRALKGIPRGGQDKQVPLVGVGYADGAALLRPQRPSAQAPTTTEPEPEATPISQQPLQCNQPEPEPDQQPEQTTAAGQTSDRPERSSDPEQVQLPNQHQPRELIPGELLPPGPAEHPCRYAGTLLVCAAAQVLGVARALKTANVARPLKAVYDAFGAVMSLAAAWAAGFSSLESMHERDARSLGVILGLERSPSVRTLHRAIAQMASVFDPIALGVELLRGLIAAVGQVPRVLGVDGHFKVYCGSEPIDKGRDSKRRMMLPGLSDVVVHDEQGRIWLWEEVGANDKLSAHVLSVARQIKAVLKRCFVMAFDRGGFSFDVLNTLNAEEFGYLTYVPATVTMPELSQVAPEDDGVGEILWDHGSLSQGHQSRFLVLRDGEALVPAATNLPEKVSPAEAMEMLHSVRGWQENDFKAARAFAHIDRLADRGGARHAPDDRPVNNPVHKDLKQQRADLRQRLGELGRQEPISRADKAAHGGHLLIASFQEAVFNARIGQEPEKVPKCSLEPDALRAWLKTTNRALLQPLKYCLENSHRWLLSALGSALSPSDHEWDASTRSRTLQSLLRAPGTVRLSASAVDVTLELPLPPTAHQRLTEGLESLDDYNLRFTDGQRAIRFRLAPRPSRQSLPSSRDGSS